MSYLEEYLNLRPNTNETDDTQTASIWEEYETLNTNKHLVVSSNERTSTTPSILEVNPNVTHNLWNFLPSKEWLKNPSIQYQLLDNNQSELIKDARDIAYTLSNKVHNAFDMDFIFQLDQRLRNTKESTSQGKTNVTKQVVNSVLNFFNEERKYVFPSAHSITKEDPDLSNGKGYTFSVPSEFSRCLMIDCQKGFLSGPRHECTQVKFKLDSNNMNYKEFHYNFASTLIPRLILWLKTHYIKPDNSGFWNLLKDLFTTDAQDNPNFWIIPYTKKKILELRKKFIVTFKMDYYSTTKDKKEQTEFESDTEKYFIDKVSDIIKFGTKEVELVPIGRTSSLYFEREYISASLDEKIQMENKQAFLGGYNQLEIFYGNFEISSTLHKNEADRLNNLPTTSLRNCVPGDPNCIYHPSSSNWEGIFGQLKITKKKESTKLTLEESSSKTKYIALTTPNSNIRDEIWLKSDTGIEMSLTKEINSFPFLSMFEIDPNEKVNREIIFSDKGYNSPLKGGPRYHTTFLSSNQILVQVLSNTQEGIDNKSTTNQLEVEITPPEELRSYVSHVFLFVTKDFGKIYTTKDFESIEKDFDVADVVEKLTSNVDKKSSNIKGKMSHSIRQDDDFSLSSSLNSMEYDTEGNFLYKNIKRNQKVERLKPEGSHTLPPSFQIGSSQHIKPMLNQKKTTNTFSYCHSCQNFHQCQCFRTPCKCCAPESINSKNGPSFGGYSTGSKLYEGPTVSANNPLLKGRTPSTTPNSPTYVRSQRPIATSQKPTATTAVTATTKKTTPMLPTNLQYRDAIKSEKFIPSKPTPVISSSTPTASVSSKQNIYTTTTKSIPKIDNRNNYLQQSILKAATTKASFGHTANKNTSSMVPITAKSRISATSPVSLNPLDDRKKFSTRNTILSKKAPVKNQYTTTTTTTTTKTSTNEKLSSIGAGMSPGRPFINQDRIDTPRPIPTQSQTYHKQKDGTRDIYEDQVMKENDVHSNVLVNPTHMSLWSFVPKNLSNPKFTRIQTDSEASDNRPLYFNTNTYNSFYSPEIRTKQICGHAVYVKGGPVFAKGPMSNKNLAWEGKASNSDTVTSATSTNDFFHIGAQEKAQLVDKYGNVTEVKLKPQRDSTLQKFVKYTGKNAAKAQMGTKRAYENFTAARKKELDKQRIREVARKEDLRKQGILTQERLRDNNLDRDKSTNNESFNTENKTLPKIPSKTHNQSSGSSVDSKSIDSSIELPSSELNSGSTSMGSSFSGSESSESNNSSNKTQKLKRNLSKGRDRVSSLSRSVSNEALKFKSTAGSAKASLFNSKKSGSKSKPNDKSGKQPKFKAKSELDRRSRSKTRTSGQKSNFNSKSKSESKTPKIATSRSRSRSKSKSKSRSRSKSESLSKNSSPSRSSRSNILPKSEKSKKDKMSNRSPNRGRSVSRSGFSSSSKSNDKSKTKKSSFSPIKTSGKGGVKTSKSSSPGGRKTKSKDRSKFKSKSPLSSSSSPSRQTKKVKSKTGKSVSPAKNKEKSKNKTKTRSRSSSSTNNRKKAFGRSKSPSSTSSSTKSKKGRSISPKSRTSKGKSSKINKNRSRSPKSRPKKSRSRSPTSKTKKGRSISRSPKSKTTTKSKSRTRSRSRSRSPKLKMKGKKK